MKKKPHDKLPSTFSAVAQASRLVRRKASPMALEQRFMFDGAAFVEATAVLAADPQQAPAQESAAVDGALTSALSADTDATTDTSPHADSPSLFTLVVDGDSGPSGKLEQGVAAAEQTLLGWAGSAGAVADVGAIFAPQDSGHGTPDGRVAQVLEGIRSGDISVSLELRDPSDLLGAMGAFAASGPGGTPVIYLNRDWVESANTTREAIVAVLLEEYGHYLDSMLNQGGDAAGDEGEAFANRLLEESTSEADRQRIAAERDAVVVWLEGQKVHLELASLLFSKAAYFAEDYAEPGSQAADLEGNTLTLLDKVNQADGATQFLFNSDPESAPVYSGNNVRGTLYAIDANGLVVGSYYGEISRLVKSGSIVQAGQFFVYPNGDNTATRAPSTTILIDFGTGGEFFELQTIRTSSDPVDTAMNNLLPQPTPPDAMADDGLAHEPGGIDNGSLPTDLSGEPVPLLASGNLLSNDTGAGTTYAWAFDSYNSTTNLVTNTSGGLQVTRVTSSLTGDFAEPVPDFTGLEYAVSVTGKYGSLLVSADGSYTYQVFNAQPEVEALRDAGDVLQDTFSYQVLASNGLTDTSTLTITIEGFNDNPKANNDYDVAKESLRTDGTAYAADDPYGLKAEGNVLANDTDVDRYGEQLSIAGVHASATGISPSDTVLVFSAVSPSVKTGFFVFLDGATPLLLRDENGDPITVFNDTSTNVQLSGFVYNHKLTGTETLGFAQNEDGSSNYKTATIIDVTALATTALVVSGADADAGRIAEGMTVSGAGIPDGTTVVDVIYAADGKITAVTLSQAATVDGTVDFLASAGSTVTGRYGTLRLNADGSYVYTPTDPNNLLTAGISGVDRFNYTMTDLAGAKSIAVLTIDVLGSGEIDPNANADAGDAFESGGTANAIAPANASPTGNLLTNDTQPTADTDANDNYVSEVKTASDPSGANPVGSVEYTTPEGVVETWGAKLQGLHGDLYVSADGSYRYVVNDNDPQVQALKSTADTLTDTFQYKVGNTETTGGSDWAELTITIKGSNDAPVASDDQAYAREAVGTPAADPAGNADGNVLTNDTDADAGDTKRVVDVTAIDITSPTAIQIGDGGTVIPGKYGQLVMGPDGTYTYSVNNSHPEVNALSSNSTLLESFAYTVTDAGGLTHTAILTITILGVDDGLSVSTVTVNEGSPYAVFTVTGTPGQATYLSLDNEQTTGLERLEYHDPNSTDANANGWVLYTSGTVNLDANGELLVRVAIDPEQEAMLDSPETFRLIATNVNGIESAFDAGIGTILDDGTGDYFADDNTDGVSVVPEGVTLDDDSPGMTIVPVTVEEGSTAVFNVTVTAAEAPYTVTFATSLSSQSAEADDIGALVVKDSTGQVIEPNQDGSYTVPAGTTALTVEVITNDDDVYEGSETFLLTGKTEFMASNTSAAGTLKDDGSLDGDDGDVVADDDRAITVTGVDDVSEGSYAVFTVALPQGNPHATEIGLSLSMGSAEVADYSELAGARAFYVDGDGQKQTLTITDGKITLLAGVSRFFVSVPTADDTLFEGAETLRLSATIINGKSASDTATILDDGSGKVYDENGTVSGATPDNDRPAPAPVAESAAVDAPVAVVLAPEASTPREPLRFDSTIFVALPSDQQSQLSVEVLALVQRSATETEVPRLLTQATGFQVLVNERQSGQLELNRTIDKQFVEAGAQGSISLPFDTFTHNDPNARIILAANLSDGRPLPKWVSFDARTGTFTVQAPAGYVGDLEVEVSARDDKGNEVKTKFKLTVGAKAAVTGREGLSDQLRQASKSAFVWRDTVRGEPAAAPAREPAPAQQVQRVDA